MTTAYEALFIVDTTLAEDQMNAVINKYTEVITRGGGEVDDIDRWEPRRLAYEVKGRREGIYIVVNFRSEPEAKNELDRIFRISDDVLRYMIVRQSDKADRFPSRARAAEYERRERELAARAAAAPPPAGDETVTELGNGDTAAAEAPADDVAEATPAVEVTPATTEEATSDAAETTEAEPAAADAES
jgi:ribosomal protein S6